MKRHLVLVAEVELEDLLSGKTEYLLRFIKKHSDFISGPATGDLIYLRLKKGEIKARFTVSKLVLIEKPETSDFKIIKNFSRISEEDFLKKADKNNIAVIVRIEKLEQFITSPIDTPKSNKEWIVLEEGN